MTCSPAKEYTVSWDGKVYAANDNATHWQGYAGYPIIAVLMLQGKLPFDKSVADKFADISGKELISAKRDYARAVDIIFRQKHCDKDTENKSRAEVGRVYEALKNLDVEIKHASKRLPKHAKERYSLLELTAWIIKHPSHIFCHNEYISASGVLRDIRFIDMARYLAVQGL